MEEKKYPKQDNQIKTLSEVMHLEGKREFPALCGVLPQQSNCNFGFTKICDQ